MKTKTSTTRMMWRSNPERCGVLRLGAAALVLTAGCSPQQQPSEKVDIANAARAAQESIGNYARSQPATADRPRPGLSAPAASDSPTEPQPEPTPTPAQAGEPSARQAADVLRSYHALIAQRRYRAAWQLWARDGAASGMSADAFAASFAGYRDWHADVGTPGRIDAGAGQRYITIPVKVTGTMRNGKPFTLQGPTVLHRAGDIDGATAEQRSWHIYESGLKSQPSSSPRIPGKVLARYRCADGLVFRVTFDNLRDAAVLALPSGAVRLAGQRPASGIWYAGQGYELRGKGKNVTLSRPDAPPLTCRADD